MQEQMFNYPLVQQGHLGFYSLVASNASYCCIDTLSNHLLVSPQNLTAVPPELFPCDSTDVLCGQLFEQQEELLINNEAAESDSDVERDFIGMSAPGSRTCTPTPMTKEGKGPISSLQSSNPRMEKFPEDKVSDFKHVIYNLLVDHYNDPCSTPFVEPVTLVISGEVRTGFRFPDAHNPEKKLPELYAQHIRRSRLDLENHDSIFIQDLYKFYLRACLELLAKYFEKCDKYTFLDDGVPLFVAGTSLKEAEQRMKTMRTRARKRKSAASEGKPVKKGRKAKSA